MNIKDLPVFFVSEVQPDSPQLQGKVSRLHWVGEGHFAYLYLEDGTFVKGNFQSVDKTTNSVSFAFKHPDSVPAIQPDESIPYFDGYWGVMARISLDRSLAWQELIFEPLDTIMTFWDGRKEEIPGGWDHGHCAICFTTISQQEITVFMKSSQNHCICLDCFRKYVEPHNIDFIEEA